MNSRKHQNLNREIREHPDRFEHRFGPRITRAAGFLREAIGTLLDVLDQVQIFLPYRKHPPHVFEFLFLFQFPATLITVALEACYDQLYNPEPRPPP